MIEKIVHEVEEAIRAGIRRQIEEVVREEVELASKRVQSRIEEIAAGIALRMTRTFDVRRVEDRIVITVQVRNER